MTHSNSQQLKDNSCARNEFEEQLRKAHLKRREKSVQRYIYHFYKFVLPIGFAFTILHLEYGRLADSYQNPDLPLHCLFARTVNYGCVDKSAQ